MNAVAAALARAARDLLEPKMLAIALVPPAAALAVWGAAAWALAGDWARLVADWIANTPSLAWLVKLGLSWVFAWASGIAAVALLLPLVLATAVLVAELVAMPIVVPWVAERYFPRLERRRGGTAVGSVLNAATAVGVFFALWLASLPLWLTGLGALVLPPLLAAHFNQRVFRYDALAEHATREEYERIVALARGRLFGLGLVLSGVYSIPVANLAAPALSALAFTHLCLAELARLRERSERPSRSA
jgi:hypothetical protein